MRILFITHRLPYPPDKGERIRAFHELKYLAARHEVDLFRLADSTNDIDNKAPYLRDICRKVHLIADQCINEFVAEAVPRCEAETVAADGVVHR